MVQRGANHTKALTVVAAHLARRLWRVLERQRPLSSATSTAGPSPLRRPPSSSPSATPCPRTSAAGGAPATRPGRSLTRSSRDMRSSQAHKAPAARGDLPQPPSSSAPPVKVNDHSPLTTKGTSGITAAGRRASGQATPYMAAGDTDPSAGRPRKGGQQWEAWSRWWSWTSVTCDCAP
jgi:hypothetical protein